MTNSAVKLAILDVDGTLFNGNLGIEFIKVLIENGLFTKELGEQIFTWYQKYKNGQVEKTIAVDEIYNLYATGLKGKAREEIDRAAVETWEKIKSELFPFSIELVDFLKANNFVVILLSGSPIEMISKLGKSMNIGITNCLAGEIEITNNVYTGQINSYPGSAIQKIQTIESYIEREGITVNWAESLGMGDNERDVGILDKTGISVAIEPNESLKKTAEANNWIIASADTVLDLVKAAIFINITNC